MGYSITHPMTSLHPRVFLAALFLLGGAAGLQALPPDKQSPAPASSESEAVAAMLRTAPRQQYDFNKAVLGHVIRFLARDAKISLFTLPDDNPKMTHLITFNWDASPFSVLETLCRVNGLTLALKDGTWYVRAADNP
jgi:hypothetical protein